MYQQIRWTRVTARPSDTRSYARRLAARLTGGTVVLLSGPVGAGKTTFAQGLASGLGVKKNVRSASFTLVSVYRASRSGLLWFVHADCYRIRQPLSLAQLGLDAHIGRPDVICAIEWPPRVRVGHFGNRVVRVRLAPGRKPNERRVIISQPRDRSSLR